MSSNETRPLPFIGSSGNQEAQQAQIRAGEADLLRKDAGKYAVQAR
jgi:hypothetical protein